MIKSIAKWCNIYPGEGRLVGLMLTHHFCLEMACFFIYTTAYSLFLMNFNSSMLPYIYICTSIVTPLVSFFYLILASYISFSKLLLTNLGLLLLVNIVIWSGLWSSESRWLIFVLPIWSEVTYVFVSLEFWGLAARLFDIRQSKRLFGILGGGAEAANIVSGFLISFVVVVSGARNLLLIGSLPLIGAIGLLAYITRSYRKQVDASTDEDEEEGETKTSSSLIKNWYIVLIFLLTLLLWISFYGLENIFYDQVSVQYADENQLSGFLGKFFAIVSGGTLLATVFLTGPFMSRYGLKASLLVLPVTLFVTIGLMAAGGTVFGQTTMLFWLILLAKCFNDIFLYSISGVATEILHQPLPPHQRVQAQSIREGIIFPVAVGITGVLLLLLRKTFALNVTQLIYGLLFVIICWIVVAVFLGQEYPLRLKLALAKRDLGDLDLRNIDSSGLAILAEGLHSPHVGVVIYSLDMLEVLDPELLAPLLPELLDHAEAEVRCEALRRIERLGLTDLLPVIRHKLRDEHVPAVQGAILRTLAEFEESDAFDDIAAYIKEPNPDIRQGAMVGLLRSGGIYGILLAGTDFLKQAASADPAERVFAADLLGEVGISDFYQPLLTLLKDGDPDVRQAALLSAGKLKNPKLWHLAIDALHSPKTRSAAILALSAGGESALPVLQAAFAATEHSSPVLIACVQICGRIGGEDAITLLKDRIDVPQDDVRAQVLRSLSLCGYQAHTEDSARIQRQLTAEIMDATESLVILADIGDTEAVSLLHRTLHDKLKQIRERCFYLLSFIYDAPTILRIQDTLAHSSKEEQAYALEALDVLLSQDVKNMVFPLIEHATPDRQLSALDKLFPQTRKHIEQRLQELIAASDHAFTPWIRGCALYALSLLDIPVEKVVKTATSMLSDPDPFLKETAFWMLIRLQPAIAKTYCKHLQNESYPSIVRLLGLLETNGKNEQNLTTSAFTTIEKILFLRNVALFNQIVDEALFWISEVAQDIRFAPGEQFITQGDHGDCLYVIISGSVDIHIDGVGKVAMGKQGDVLGEMAILLDSSRTANCIAVTDVAALKIARAPFLDLLKEKSELALGIIEVLIQRIKERDQKTTM